MRHVCLIALFVILGACGCGGNSAGACYVDGECPVHQYCQAPTGTCVSGCLADSDCQGKSCDPHGRCISSFASSDGGTPIAPPDLAGVDFAGADLSGVASDLGPPPVDLAVVDAWICTGTCPDYMKEPNDTPAQATPVTVGATLPDLAICPKNDIDFYKLPSGKAGLLVATVTNGPCGSPVRVDLFDSNGTTPIGSTTLSAGGAVAQARIIGKQSPYVRVEAASAGGQNLYTLAIVIQ